MRPLFLGKEAEVKTLLSQFVSSGVEIAKNQRFEFGRVSTLSSRLTDPAAVLRPIKAKP